MFHKLHLSRHFPHKNKTKNKTTLSEESHHLATVCRFNSMTLPPLGVGQKNANKANNKML